MDRDLPATVRISLEHADRAVEVFSGPLDRVSALFGPLPGATLPVHAPSLYVVSAADGFGPYADVAHRADADPAKGAHADAAHGSDADPAPGPDADLGGHEGLVHVGCSLLNG